MRDPDHRPAGIGAALGLAALLAGAAPAEAQARSNYEELQTFSGVLNHIRINYVDSVQYAQLVRAAIDGVLRSLDPHCRFEPREDVARGAALTRGELGTIGLSLEEVDGIPTVLNVVPGGPADRKGIMAGDRLVAVDDSSIQGLDAPAIELKLAGRSGSRVKLRLERGSRLEPRRYEVSVKRNDLKIPAIGLERMLDPTTGYLWLSQFTPDAPEELEKSIDRLRRNGARQIMLDLRFNPGGSVTSAVDVASLFLPRNTLVFRTRGRKSQVDEDYVTKRDGKFDHLPLVVLIDERSASAAEALAGTLQDHDRAVLVGRRTFGKALMQMPFALPAGDVVWLTIGRILTPSGRFIQRRYQGLMVQQYLDLAGGSGAESDTTEIFKTDRGRSVRGGGGIRPDVESPTPTPLPAWHAVAADSGFEEAVADSVAHELPPTPDGRAAWIGARDRWHTELLAPFLTRVRTRLGVAADADSGQASRMARRLAGRTAEVRWGVDARDELILRHDPVVALALAQFPRLPQLLASPSQ